MSQGTQTAENLTCNGTSVVSCSMKPTFCVLHELRDHEESRIMTSCQSSECLTSSQHWCQLDESNDAFGSHNARLRSEYSKATEFMSLYEQSKY